MKSLEAQERDLERAQAEKVLTHFRERGMEEMIAEIARMHQVMAIDVVGKDRTNRPTRARHAFWWKLRNELKWSYPEIAKVFSVNYTSVLKAVTARHFTEGEQTAVIDNYKSAIARGATKEQALSFAAFSGPVGVDVAVLKVWVEEVR